MGWSLVCACWQSVRNICFGRCCGHMIPSIHKVPACPFTALYTVSHCTDDRTNDRISCAFLHHASPVFSLYHAHKAPHRFDLSRLFFFSSTISEDFFLWWCVLSQGKSYAPVSHLQCLGLMFETHPCFSPFHLSRPFMSLIDLMHGDFVLELHFWFFYFSLYNMCHGGLFSSNQATANRFSVKPLVLCGSHTVLGNLRHSQFLFLFFPICDHLASTVW